MTVNAPFSNCVRLRFGVFATVALVIVLVVAFDLLVFKPPGIEPALGGELSEPQTKALEILLQLASILISLAPLFEEESQTTNHAEREDSGQRPG